MTTTRFLSLLALFTSLAALALSTYQRQLWTQLEPFTGTESEAFQRGRWLGWREAAESFRRQRESATNFSPAIGRKITSMLAEKLLLADSPVPDGARGDWGGIFETLPTLSYQRDGVCRTAPGEHSWQTGVTLSDAENLR